MGMYDDTADDELTVEQVVQLESSTNPDDQARAKRTIRVPEIKGLAFELPKLAWQEQFTESMRRDQERINSSLAEIAQIQHDRDNHKYDAEQAAIDTSELLGALVRLSEAQQQQLVTQGTLLKAMVEQTATLTAHARAESAQADQRWAKAWIAQVVEVTVGLVAAVLAGLALWATLSQKAPVVNVPASVVSVVAPTTTAPAPPVIEAPTPDEQLPAA